MVRQKRNRATRGDWVARYPRGIFRGVCLVPRDAELRKSERAVTAAPGIPCTGEEEKIIEQERDEIDERRKRRKRRSSCRVQVCFWSQQQGYAPLNTGFVHWTFFLRTFEDRQSEGLRWPIPLGRPRSAAHLQRHRRSGRSGRSISGAVPPDRPPCQAARSRSVGRRRGSCTAWERRFERHGGIPHGVPVSGGSRLPEG